MPHAGLATLFCSFAIGFLPPQDEGGPVVEVTDAGERIERSVTMGPRGDRVSDGSYKSFHPNGQLQSAGEYDLGSRAGTWKFYFDNGQLRAEGDYKDDQRVGKWELYHPNGRLAGKGVYRGGLRNGRWNYTDEAGKRTAESGKFKIERAEYEDGSLKYEGERRSKYRHGAWRWFRADGVLASEGQFNRDQEDGPWTWYWPDGSWRLRGRYGDGERVGVWSFRHASGVEDPEFLSRRYADGSTGGATGDSGASTRRPLADLDVVPDAILFPGLTGPDFRRLEELVRMVTTSRGSRISDALEELARWELAPLPTVLNELKRLDLRSDRRAATARRLYISVLGPAVGGNQLDWQSGYSGEAAQVNRLSLLRMFTLWELTAGQTEFWNEVRSEREDGLLNRLATDHLYEALRTDPLSLPGMALKGPVDRTSDAALAQVGKKFDAGDTRETLDRALAWLAKHQAENGGWDGDGFAGAEAGAYGALPGIGQAYHDVGLSALSLMAFLSAGNTLLDGPYLHEVHLAVDFLRAAQDPQSGLFQAPKENTAFFYCHTMATQALAEASTGSTNPVLRGQVRRALDAILLAQNRSAGWGYSEKPAGDSNTSTTIWALSALGMAKRAGYEVDSAALRGGIAWLDQMTDDQTARTGYQEKGSYSVRTQENVRYAYGISETLTAASIWCRILTGEGMREEALLQKQAQLVQTRLPNWRPGSPGHDMMGWYFGTQAFFHLGKKHWKPWNRAMKKTLVAAQRGDGVAAGSFDPIGPWGWVGGRVYSTAMAALCLGVYYRFPRLMPQ